MRVPLRAVRAQGGELIDAAFRLVTEAVNGMDEMYALMRDLPAVALERGGRLERTGLVWLRDRLYLIVSAQVKLLDGRPAIVGLHLDPLEDGANTSADWVLSADRLRRLPLRRIIDAAWAQRRLDFRAAIDQRVLERAPGRPWPDEHYDRVAQVYEIAVAAGSPPLKAIQERWHTSRPNARKWVAQARRRGLLGYPDRPGVAGASEDRSFTGKGPST